VEYLREQFHEELGYEENLFVKEGRLFIRNAPSWTPEEVLQAMSPEVYKSVFQDWLQERRSELIGRAEDILEKYEQGDRFAMLRQAFQRGTVMPFVGAGLSIPSGYPGWTKFLYRLQRQTGINEEAFRQMLEQGKYEEAAQNLAEELKVAFNEEVENAFSVERKLQGPVQLLPYVFDTAVVTTNFDDVLNRCYQNAQKAFSDTLPGTQADELPRYLGTGQRVLVKMHGKATSGVGRILTASEYQEKYEQDGVMKRVIRSICSRTLLFVGCSLTVDRALLALQSLVDGEGHDRVPRHYAFLEAPTEEQNRRAIRARLAGCNIYPIWYPNGEHDNSIEAFLLKLADGVVDFDDE
jgi:hypothetical protein